MFQQLIQIWIDQLRDLGRHDSKDDLHNKHS